MKTASIWNNLNHSGAKHFARKNGITAVTTETDCVYLFSDSTGKPLRILFNPRTGECYFTDKNGVNERNTLENAIGYHDELKRIYYEGLRILSASGYSPPQTERGEIRKWLQHLWNRPPLNKEELISGNRQVVEVSKFSNNTMSAHCMTLGDYLSPDTTGRFLNFQTGRDPVLGPYGIYISEAGNGRINVISSLQAQDQSIGISDNSKVVQLTAEDIKRLQELVLPLFPSQSFLNFHAGEMDTRKQKRGRKILRGVSRTGEINLSVGTVAI